MERAPPRTAASRSVRQAKDPKDFGGDYDKIREELQKGDGWGSGYSMASVLNTVSNNSFGECPVPRAWMEQCTHTTPQFRLPTRRHHPETMMWTMVPTVLPPTTFHSSSERREYPTSTDSTYRSVRPCRQGGQRDLQVNHGQRRGPPSRAEQREDG